MSNKGHSSNSNSFIATSSSAPNFATPDINYTSPSYLPSFENEISTPQVATPSLLVSTPEVFSLPANPTATIIQEPLKRNSQKTLKNIGVCCRREKKKSKIITQTTLSIIIKEPGLHSQTAHAFHSLSEQCYAAGRFSFFSRTASLHPVD